MDVSGDYRSKAPVEVVWKALMSRESLEKAVPGCEKLVETAPLEYVITLKIGVASLKGTYTGKMRITDVDQPRHFILVVEGAGTRGHLNGEGFFDIQGVGEGNKYRTVIKYRGVAHIGGTLAGIGTRLLSPIVRILIGNFFKNIDRQIDNPENNISD
jgi:carbon monoxide dehydrogenase subunit G